MVALMHTSLAHLDFSVAKSTSEKSAYQSALGHLKVVTGIFVDLSESGYTTANPSIEREHLEALHLEALIHCTTGSYLDAEHSWKTAIEKAKRLALFTLFSHCIELKCYLLVILIEIYEG